VRADFAVVSRRRLLKYGLSAAAFLGMGGVGSLLALRGRAPDVAGLRCLTAHEYRTLERLADALFPAGGAFALGADYLDLAHQLDGFLADEPPWNVLDLKRALALLEFGPVLFDRRLATFSHLPADERLAHFERWTTSSSDTLRGAALAFRRFLTTRFYDRPAAWPSVGYEGPLVNVKDA
jgi:hypothetical protein